MFHFVCSIVGSQTAVYIAGPDPPGPSPLLPSAHKPIFFVCIFENLEAESGLSLTMILQCTQVFVKRPHVIGSHASISTRMYQ